MAGYTSTVFKPVEPEEPKPCLIQIQSDSEDVEIIAEEIEPRRLFASPVKLEQTESENDMSNEASSVNSGTIPAKYGGRKKPISSAFMLKKTSTGRIENPENLPVQVLNSDDMFLNPLGMCNTILSKKMYKKRKNLYKN